MALSFHSSLLFIVVTSATQPTKLFLSFYTVVNGYYYKVVLEWFLLEGVKELEFGFSPLCRRQRDLEKEVFVVVVRDAGDN